MDRLRFTFTYVVIMATSDPYPYSLSHRHRRTLTDFLLVHKEVSSRVVKEPTVDNLQVSRKKRKINNKILYKVYSAVRRSDRWSCGPPLLDSRSSLNLGFILSHCEWLCFGMPVAEYLIIVYWCNLASNSWDQPCQVAIGHRFRGPTTNKSIELCRVLKWWYIGWHASLEYI